MSKKHHNQTHGMSKSRTYTTWAEMKQRCLNPNDPMYYRYGGRGIKVCKRWMDSFEAFLEDVGERPDECTLDRLDSDRDYEPGNVRWATALQQARNRSNNVNITFQGKTMCISAWAEELGLPRKTVEKRINYYGMSVEEALTRPVRGRKVPQ